MTDREEAQLRAAVVTLANALEMDEGEAFRSPLAFAVRASVKVYEMRRELATRRTIPEVAP